MTFFRNEINSEQNQNDVISSIEIDNTNVIQNHTLNVSITPEKIPNILKLYGRRIVDIAFIFEQIAETDCCFKDMVCIREKSIGLISSFTFVCTFCKIEKTIFSENQTKSEMMDLNTAAVAGNMNFGAGYSQLETIISALEIPSMSQFIYNKHHSIVCNGYEKAAEKAMKDAAKEETELAILLGNVDVDVIIVGLGFKCNNKL